MTILRCRCGANFVPQIRGDEIPLACDSCRRDKKLWSGKGTVYDNYDNQIRRAS